MASKGQRTGMRAVYQVAAELVARGFIVSPTSRSAFGADLLVTDESCRRAFSVQVKANSRPSGFWLVGKDAKTLTATSHVYVLVNFNDATASHDFYIVPSKVVASRMLTQPAKTGSVWYSFSRKDASAYKDAWKVFGCSEQE
jgi:hypothetical protein